MVGRGPVSTAHGIFAVVRPPIWRKSAPMRLQAVAVAAPTRGQSLHAFVYENAAAPQRRAPLPLAFQLSPAAFTGLAAGPSSFAVSFE